MLVIMVMSLTAFLLFKRSRGHPPEAELYLKLRESCRRAGFRADEAVAPLSLLDELASVGHPAQEPARTVVHSYLRSRFGGQELDARERKKMKSDLADVRRALRRTRGPTDEHRHRL
jgi:hypothetical protein